MRCINARRISEAAGTVALVLLVLLPRGFCTRDDVSVTDPEDCDEASEGSTHGRGCGGGGGPSHHATPEGNPAANDSTGGGAPRPSRQQWMDRLRRKETWKNVLLQRLWHARRNSSTVGGSQIVSRNMHTMTDLQDFKALLERGSPTHQHNNPTTTNEQDTNAKNRIYLPHCSGPRNFTGNWNDGTNFRLYFNVEHAAAESSGAGHHRSGGSRETKVQSAYLYLKRKTTTTSVSPSRATPTTAAGIRPGRQPSGGDGQAVRGGQRGQTVRRRRPLRGVSDSSAPPYPHPTPLDGGDSSGQLKVIVYLYSRQTKRARQETRSAVRTVHFSRNLTGWLRVNLTATVDDWSKRPQRNFGIQVTVQNEAGTTTTAAAEELHPGDYFDGFNCTEDQSHPTPVEFPLWTLEDTLVNDTVVDSDMNFTQPYLDVITTEVARSRSRFQRDLRAANSAPSALHNA